MPERQDAKTPRRQEPAEALDELARRVIGAGIETLLPKPKAQGKAYLQATGNQLALVINFNEAVLRDGIHRVVLTS